MKAEDVFIQQEIEKTRNDLKKNRSEFEDLLNISPTWFDFFTGRIHKKTTKQYDQLKLNGLEHAYLCEKLNYYLTHGKA